ncbi:AbrB/MazE/SpoVT family DNA-binding domain-containing protein [Companilactobacillus sp. HBUAS59699]|uniref:AbrB/MazE/SpoVT family DNA-binding domain-containing protein n=1 Tax=Companilactobacillus sp. HBUAS59699 TaxID=3109358 RepID=UPI002FEFB71C
MEMKKIPVSYKTKISKWGNSNGLRIPQEILDEVSIKRNDEVDLIVDKGELIIKKRNVPSSLEELFKDYKGKPFKSGEIDWGEKRGHEYW